VQQLRFLQTDVVIKRRQNGGFTGSIFVRPSDSAEFLQGAFNAEWPVIAIRFLCHGC
jgi:hypothetical protein